MVERNEKRKIGEPFEVLIDGVKCKINPNPPEEDVESRVYMDTLHNIRNQRSREGKEVYFDGFGRLRGKRERELVRRGKEVVLKTLDTHISILQGKQEGVISFIRNSNNNIVGLAISESQTPKK